ncbi:MAG: monomethylamine:corrinoid methyltransferase [Acidimicrobiia bacterium]|nr:monomethylamine:corrinoid methyltransferase [Acidimicrobiia bacterium]
MANATPSGLDYFLSVLDRAESGPVVTEKEWDRVYVNRTVQDLVDRYDIAFDRDNVGVPADDALADRLFEAGMELATSSGVFCLETQRRITFKRDELDDVLAAVPEEVAVGHDEEELMLRKRSVDGAGSIAFGGGPWGIAIGEEQFLPLALAYVKEPLIDFFCTPSLTSTYGRPIRARAPSDALACWQETRLTQEALRQAGRPGMAVCAPNTTASAIGVLTTVSHDGLRPRNWHNNSFVSELKVSYEDLLRTAHFLHVGATVHNFYNSIFGGYAGGAEGTAIVHVASFVLMRAVLQGHFFNTGTSHAHLSANTLPLLIHSQSAGYQALSRNTNLTLANFTRPLAGPGERQLLDEVAAYQIATIPAGVEVAKGVQTATGRFEGHCSPLEARFAAQVARASVGMTRSDAHGLVQRLTARYEADANDVKPGRPFDQVYDLDELQPTADWQGTYEAACAELSALGLGVSPS